MKIIKIPLTESAASGPGTTDKAPDMIVEELKKIHLNESFRKPVFDVCEINPSGSLSEKLDKIEKRMYDELSTSYSKPDSNCNRTNDRIVIIGGCHSLTYATFAAFANQNPGSGLVLIDAHPDLMQEYGADKKEDYLRALINTGILLPDRLMIVGARNIEPSEKQYIDAKRIKVFTMKHIFNSGISDFCDGLMEFIRTVPAVYLSIDIDSADPSCAPGTGSIEPGGFSAREIIYLVQRLSLIKNIKVVDIVEVEPDLDFNKMTSRLAAKLINELS
jgi:arginase family enzyme